ncbi:MAG: heptaprenyl diphosphate synthase, partial [Thermotogae bacterium]
MVNHSVRVVRTALLGAIGTAVYLIETLIPFPLPFGRWGLSNFTVLAAAIAFGTREAVSVALVKSLLGSIFTG